MHLLGTYQVSGRKAGIVLRNFEQIDSEEGKTYGDYTLGSQRPPGAWTRAAQQPSTLTSPKPEELDRLNPTTGLRWPLLAGLRLSVLNLETRSLKTHGLGFTLYSNSHT